MKPTLRGEPGRVTREGAEWLRRTRRVELTTPRLCLLEDDYGHPWVAFDRPIDGLFSVPEELRPRGWTRGEQPCAIPLRTEHIEGRTPVIHEPGTRVRVLYGDSFRGMTATVLERSGIPWCMLDREHPEATTCPDEFVGAVPGDASGQRRFWCFAGEYLEPVGLRGPGVTGEVVSSRYEIAVLPPTPVPSGGPEVLERGETYSRVRHPDGSVRFVPTSELDELVSPGVTTREVVVARVPAKSLTRGSEGG